LIEPSQQQLLLTLVSQPSLSLFSSTLFLFLSSFALLSFSFSLSLSALNCNKLRQMLPTQVTYHQSFVCCYSLLLSFRFLTSPAAAVAVAVAANVSLDVNVDVDVVRKCHKLIYGLCSLCFHVVVPAVVVVAVAVLLKHQIVYAAFSLKGLNRERGVYNWEQLH